jgi:hypothetical protein
MDKAKLISIFNEIAVLLELQGENVFKIRSYVNAAKTLEALQDDPGGNQWHRQGIVGEDQGILPDRRNTVL